jgi:hypothetical protein
LQLFKFSTQGRNVQKKFELCHEDSTNMVQPSTNIWRPVFYNYFTCSYCAFFFFGIIPPQPLFENLVQYFQTWNMQFDHHLHMKMWKSATSF